jgi:small subunit ribosomal protein S9
MPKESNKYIEAIGRRKTSVARVRITKASKASILINEKSLADYFPVKDDQSKVSAPFTHLDQKFETTVLVKGGGINSQAEAIRLGLSRALIVHDAELRKELKKEGYLKRDPRAKERRKFGLKKARKAPQWSKR